MIALSAQFLNTDGMRCIPSETSINNLTIESDDALTIVHQKQLKVITINGSTYDYDMLFGDTFSKNKRSSWQPKTVYWLSDENALFTKLTIKNQKGGILSEIYLKIVPKNQINSRG